MKCCQLQVKVCLGGFFSCFGLGATKRHEFFLWRMLLRNQCLCPRTFIFPGWICFQIFLINKQRNYKHLHLYLCIKNMLKNISTILYICILCFLSISYVLSWLQICCEVKDELELLIFLPLPPDCLDYRLYPHTQVMQCWRSNPRLCICFTN